MLKIPSSGNIDFLALGALVHRLNSGVVPIEHAQALNIVAPSGGEYNCAHSLAQCFKMKSAIATAMSDYPIGELIESGVRKAGVRPFYKRFKHDGVWGPNMATVYSDQGCGVRAPVVFYNRSNEAGAQLKRGDFNWKEIFSEGVKWVHSGGIFASLSPTTSEVILEMMDAAGDVGAVRSYDLNFRAKIWAASGGSEKGLAVNDQICKKVDVLVGNEEDLQKGLGLKGPEVAASHDDLDPSAFFDIIEKQLVKKYPNIKVAATTLRQVVTSNRHRWATVAWVEGERYTTPVMELDVLDRIGGGDGFAAGLFYGLMTGRSVEESLRLGWAHGALLTTYAFDASMANLKQVEDLAKGGTARVQR